MWIYSAYYDERQVEKYVRFVTLLETPRKVVAYQKQYGNAIGYFFLFSYMDEAPETLHACILIG